MQSNKPLVNQLIQTWPQGITYEIFVQSFADSNGDGIGDLNGITAKLGYLKELGVDAIWLMPINPSPSYHKYDISDYYDIHPDYGTMEDFKNLLAEAHRLGIKVIMDLVINHCSKLHPWFISALNPNSTYRDYFIWALPEEIEKENNVLKEATGDSDNIHQWNAVNGQDEYYFSFFWSGMPDLNYDNPNLRADMYRMAEFWLSEVGVDGFRLDAAKHIYPDHRVEDTHAFWREFKSKMEAIKPDVYLVGEVWSDLETQTPYAQGFSALFNFDLSFSILESIKKGKMVSATIYKDAWKVDAAGSPVALYNQSQKAFSNYNPDFINATFLTNHDQVRTRSFLQNSLRKSKLAASILLTFPGAPYLYYGEELGMLGEKPDQNIREPFPWAAGSEDNTSWTPIIHNIHDRLPRLDQQQKIDTSMYSHYKSLIKLRRSNNIFATGDIKQGPIEDEEILNYFRTLKGESVLVLHNLTGKKKRISLDTKNHQLAWQSGKAKIIPGSEHLVLPPFQSIVFSTPKR